MSQPPSNQLPQRPTGSGGLTSAPAPGPATGRPGPSHAPRSGAHRPRRPLWHDVLPAAAVLVAVLAVVFAFFQLKDSVLGSSSTGTSDSAPGPEDQQSAAPTAPVTTSPSSTASATRTSSPTSPPPNAAATVNKKATVTVLNSTSRSGLAKSAASRLSGDGWNASSGGNQSFGGSTTVFYTQDRLAATAKAIAKDLGGYPVKQSTAYGSSGVFVILGNDYSR